MMYKSCGSECFSQNNIFDNLKQNSILSISYFLATEDLYRSDYLNRYPNPETLYATNQTPPDIVNIGIINADINKFKENAFDIGALIIQGNDSLIYDNPNSSLSPYNTFRNVFVASALKKRQAQKISILNCPVHFGKTPLYMASLVYKLILIMGMGL